MSQPGDRRCGGGADERYGGAHQTLMDDMSRGVVDNCRLTRESPAGCRSRSPRRPPLGAGCSDAGHRRGARIELVASRLVGGAERCRHRRGARFELVGHMSPRAATGKLQDMHDLLYLI